jgi:pyruvate,water dikinase
MLPDMVRDVNGRMYYDINNWYNLLKCLPMREKIIPVWQEMLGIRNKEYTLSKKAGRVRQIRAYASVLWHFVRVPADMKKLNDSFAGVLAYFEKAMPEAGDPEALAKIYEGLSERILRKWGITLLNDLYAFVFAGALKAYLKHLHIRDSETIANVHISGILNIESMKPVRSLDSLVRSAKEKGYIDILRRCTDNGETTSALAAMDESFAGDFFEYIREYGDRAPEELKLESRTFRTDPHLLARTISDRADAVTPAPDGPKGADSGSEARDRESEGTDSGKAGSPPKTETDDLSQTLANTTSYVAASSGSLPNGRASESGTARSPA